jgi:N-acetylneuraminate lyase
MPEFLERAASRLPTLVGMKYSNPDLATYLECLRGGNWDLPWGVDEAMLGALATGARGFVGSSYNFAAPLSHQIIAAFAQGNLDVAREAQHRSVRLILLLARHGYLGASKATMKLLGVDVGPARLPIASLDAKQEQALRGELEALGFFDWIQPSRPTPV